MLLSDTFSNTGRREEMQSIFHFDYFSALQRPENSYGKVTAERLVLATAVGQIEVV